MIKKNTSWEEKHIFSFIYISKYWIGNFYFILFELLSSLNYPRFGIIYKY